MTFEVRRDDLTGPEIQALLRVHLASMLSQSPPESCHVLPLEGLRVPEITFWSVWEGIALAGCGALKALDARHGEVKSMRTHDNFLKRGVGQAVLDTIILEARSRGYERISLETGTTEGFGAAQALYRKNGFAVCPPFGDYKPDPFNLFMTKWLA